MMDLMIVRDEMNQAALALFEHWMKSALDEEHGGFYNVNCWNEVMQGGEKSATLNFRIFWTFTNAYLGYNDERYLNIADRAYKYITEHFLDTEFGGAYSILNSEGEPIAKEKQGYVHSFAIAAFAAYYRATNKAESLELAKNLFELVESYGKNEYGGYHDVCARDWTPTFKQSKPVIDGEQVDKSLRPNMHLLWGFAQLRLVQESPELDEAIEKLTILLCDRLVNHESWAAQQAFSGDWNCVSDLDAYGDDFELAWIIWGALPYLKDRTKVKEIHQVCVNIVDHSIMSGVDREYGGVYQQFHHGKINTEKEWWVQTEAINGLLVAYQQTGEESYLEEAIACWNFVKENMVQPDGMWKWKTNRMGEGFNAWEIRGPLMCPYHSGRMLLQSIELLEAAIKKSA